MAVREDWKSEQCFAAEKRNTQYRFEKRRSGAAVELSDRYKNYCIVFL